MCSETYKQVLTSWLCVVKEWIKAAQGTLYSLALIDTNFLILLGRCVGRYPRLGGTEEIILSYQGHTNPGGLCERASSKQTG